MTSKPTRNRIFYLDLIRVIACAFVLMMHATLIYSKELTGTTAFTLYVLVFNISSKLFFMLSGALLLPVKREPRDFVTRRLKAVLVPLAVWTLLYFAELLIFGNPTKDELMRKVVSIFFTPVEHSLWFVYAMAGFYVMMPLVSKCIEVLDRRWIEYYLVLWLASGLIPYISGIFYPSALHHNILSSVNNFLGYMILGYYLHHYQPPIFSREYMRKLALPILACCVGLPVFVLTFQARYYLFDPDMQLAMITHDLGINTMLTGVLLFSAIQCLCKRMDARADRPNLFMRIISGISVCSFGIYLGHMIVYRRIVWPLMEQYLDPSLPPMLYGTICAVVCFAISYLIARAIYMLPFSRYIIGH